MSSKSKDRKKIVISTPRVTATAKALRILDCFTHTRPKLSLAELSRLLDMPKSTLLNQIRTLEDAGFLIKEDSNQYRLGYKLMELSYAAQIATPVAQIAIPIMEDLNETTGETIYLTSHINGLVFYLECVYSSRRSMSYSVCGKTLPMHCTGVGKAMLSHMPEKTLLSLCKNEKRMLIQ